MSISMNRVFEVHNGDKSYSPFTDVEMGRRQSNVRKWQEANNVDACLFTSYHCINYYSGFMYCYFGRKYGFVIDDKNATSISAGIDGGQPWRRTFGKNIIYTDWGKDNFFVALKQLLKNCKRVGVEFDHLNVCFKTQLEDFFPSIEFIDVGNASMWMRTIKSEEEIKLIKEGARIADLGGEACVSAISVGAPEYEVAIASTNRMIREIAASFPFVELMDTWTWFQSGMNTDGAHNPVTNKVIDIGDILSLNCFPMIFGYYTALERTLFCKHISDSSLELWERNIQVHERGLSLIKPGAKCSEIAAELNEMYHEWDLLKYRSFGYGHSFGVLCHYYGREAGVELREDVDTILEPNMVVSMEPMIMVPEGELGSGGYREHDILVITEEGAENITKFPYGPENNIII